MKVASTFVSVTVIPGLNPCAAEVVMVATFEAKAFLEIVADAKAPPLLLKVVTSIETVGPTDPDAEAAVGVTVTSVFPGATATVGAPGAIKFHCGYKVRSANKVGVALFA